MARLVAHPAPVILGHSHGPPVPRARPGPQTWTLELGAIAGVAVRVHATFLLLVGWLALASWTSAHSLAAVLDSIGFMLAVFACIVLHELGHALAARSFGIATRDITLLPIGGVGRLERMPDLPIQELWIALAGPMTSVAIAASLLLGNLTLTGSLVPASGFDTVTGPFVVRLGVVNVMLAVFNLLPSFPMDGGRVLRALLALRLDHTRATEIAAVIGRGMALLFGVVGLVSSSPLLVLVAAFVWFSASEEERVARVTAALRGIPVSATMRTTLVSLAPEDTLDRALVLAVQESQPDFPVVRDDTMVGMLTNEGLRRALAIDGPSSSVADAMQSEFETLDVDDMVLDVLPRIGPSARQPVAVMNRGRLAGLFSLDDLDEYVRLSTARASARRPGRSAAR
jgi:Zn-dependent protease/predicted transcriptional regulator